MKILGFCLWSIKKAHCNIYRINILFLLEKGLFDPNVAQQEKENHKIPYFKKSCDIAQLKIFIPDPLPPNLEYFIIGQVRLYWEYVIVHPAGWAPQF